MKTAYIRSRLLLGLGILGVAAGCFFLLRPHRAASANSPLHVSQGELLAAIPVPTGNSASDKELRKCLAGVQKTGKNDKLWANLGDVLMQRVREMGDPSFYSYAESAYNRSLELNPKNVNAMTGLAWVNGGRHMFDKSINWAQKAIAIDAQSNVAYGLIGDAELERGEYDSAFEHYQKMLDIRPDLSSYSRGAYLLHLTGNNRKAKWLMAKAVLVGAPYAENTSWCRAQLALMLYNEGNFVAAQQVLEEGLKVAPSNRHLLAVLGKVKSARRDYKGAIDVYKQAVALYPDHNSLVALGDLYTATGDKSAAETQYRAVIDLHNKNAANGAHDHMQMAQFYADHDRDLVEALRLAEEHKLSKNVFEADTLAWCYYKNGQFAPAHQAIKRALRYKTPDARILFHAGLIYARLGQEAAARNYLNQALSLNPGFHPKYAVVAADTLQKMGQVSPWDKMTEDVGSRRMKHAVQ